MTAELSMGPGALPSGRTLAREPGLPPGSGRNRGAGGRGGVGGRDPRELRRGGEPGSKGEGEGGGADKMERKVLALIILKAIGLN